MRSMTSVGRRAREASLAEENTRMSAARHVRGSNRETPDWAAALLFAPVSVAVSIRSRCSAGRRVDGRALAAMGAGYTQAVPRSTFPVHASPFVSDPPVTMPVGPSRSPFEEEPCR
jgi:hypothetical protein